MIIAFPINSLLIISYLIFILFYEFQFLKMRLFCWILENALIHCNKFVHLYTDMEIHPDTMCLFSIVALLLTFMLGKISESPSGNPRVAMSSVICHIITYQEDMPADMPAVLLIAEDTNWQTSLSHWLPCFPTTNSPASLVSTLYSLEGTNFVRPTVMNWRTRLHLPEGATELSFTRKSTSLCWSPNSEAWTSSLCVEMQDL